MFSLTRRSSKLDDLEVRVLSAEDNLRFLCLHLLRHGAVRALWLCDIAMALETRPARFGLGSRAARLAPAGRLGGLRFRACAPVVRGRSSRHACRRPRAKAAQVACLDSSRRVGHAIQIPRTARAYSCAIPLSMMRGLIKELPHHWPNPIEATMTLEGPFNDLPRLPFQVGHVFSRAAAMLAELPQIVGGPLHPRSR